MQYQGLDNSVLEFASKGRNEDILSSLSSTVMVRKISSIGEYCRLELLLFGGSKRYLNCNQNALKLVHNYIHRVLRKRHKKLAALGNRKSINWLKRHQLWKKK